MMLMICKATSLGKLCMKMVFFCPRSFDEQIYYDESMPPIYNDYCDDTYALKNNDNHETCHLDLNFQSYDSYFVEFAPTIIHEKNFAYVESSKNSILVDHEKNALCDGYIVEFIHDATENYYEGGIYACRNCNNIKFSLYMLEVLKLCMFYLPMQVDYCSHKLFDHKIPMHRKWVRLKYASHILHDALFMFQFLSFMWASLKSSCLASPLNVSACWEATQFYFSLLIFGYV